MSSKVAALGDTFEIMTVRQLPPMESFSSLVSFELRYGTYLEPSAKALMQLPEEGIGLYGNTLEQLLVSIENSPRASKLLLMLAPSRSLVAPPVMATVPRSLPARSIMLNLASLTSAERPVERDFCFKKTFEKKVC